MCKLGAALVLAALLPVSAFGTVVASLTPSTISSASTASVDLHVTGIPTGAVVTVERFLDLNANGTLDTGEPLVESATVTDGQDTQIAGVRNTNMPRDKDALVDGQITVNVNPARGAELTRLAGSQIIRVSSPSAAFSAVSAVLTISQPAQSQSISGTVLNGATAVPYAGVTLLDANAEDGEFAVGVFANASGQFTVNAPVGSYKLFAVKSGYVADLASAPVVTLGAGATPTQNLQLTSATTSISGKVADAATNAGLPGVQLFIQSQFGLLTLLSTAADGTYSAPVTADTWQIEIAGLSLSHLGYLEFDDSNPGITANPTVGVAATGVNVNLSKATALIYGTVTGTGATPLSGVRVGAGDATNTYRCEALTEADGSYVIGVTTGSWQVYLSDRNPALTGYLRPNNQSAEITGAQAVQRNFTPLAVNAHLQGTVTNTGTPVSGIRIGAFNQNTNQSLTTDTAANGTFDLGLVAGTWTLQIEATSAASFNIVSPSATYTLAENQTVSGIVVAIKSATAQINGHVRDGSAQPLSANVNANATIGGTSYSASTQTDGGGAYALPVINGTWMVSASASDYTNSDPVGVPVSGANVTRDFVLTKVPLITAQPTDQTVEVNQTFVFSINANGANAGFQWQVSTDGGSTWSNLANNATYGNVTSNVLNVTANYGLNGYRYRCVATNSFGSATSASALLTVNAAGIAPSITGHPSNQSVTTGQNATFSASATGTPPPSFQWQLSTDSGFNWSNLPNNATYSGATTGTLQVTAASLGLSGYRYRAVATNSVSSVTSNSATLTVNASAVAPAITADPANQTVIAGQGATFSVTVSGAPTPTLQWQVSNNAGTAWSTLTNNATYSGVTSATLTLSATTTNLSGYLYRAVATNTAGTATSANALLTVNPAAVAPAITADPAGQTVTAGQSATFSASASGTPTPTFQWQRSTDGGSTWGNLTNDATYSGVTSATLTVSATSTGLSGNRYRAVATNTAGTAASASALLTVNPAAVAPAIGTQPVPQTVLVGLNATFTAAATGTPAPTLQWQLSTDGGTNWSNLANDATYSGVTSATLTVTGAQLAQTGNRYRAVATNTAGSASSDGVALTVEAALLTVLHHFDIFTDAANPAVSESLTLVGNTLYGVAYGGGVNFKGAIFSVGTDGTAFSLLHSFSALSENGTNADGELPYCTLSFVGDKLYGTATSGGSLGNGTLYSLNPDGSGFATLFNFSGAPLNESYAKHSPIGRLTLAGNVLYGGTNLGGYPNYDGSGNGRLFAYTLGGTVTIPYAFPDVAWDGDHLYTPYGPGRGLVYLNGKLYGTTVSGGYE
ncbi:MAG: hypothetical protein RIQ79_2191, partial [Verrucomicrobiota bacterium]